MATARGAGAASGQVGLGYLLWGFERGQRSCKDQGGTLYVTGTLDHTGQVQFAGNRTSGSGQGAAAPYLAQYTSSGTPISFFTFGEGGVAYATDIATDNSGSVYIVGQFTGTCRFGNVTLKSDSVRTNDFFIAKVRSWGTVEWAVKGGGNDLAYAKQVRVAPNGLIYASYSYAGTTRIGNYSFRAPGNSGNVLWTRSSVIVQLSSQGVVNWAVNCANSDPLIEVNSTANLFEASKRMEYNLPFQQYLRKYNPNGTVASTLLIGQSEVQEVNNLTVDAADNVYLAGTFWNSLRVGTLTANAGTSPTSSPTAAFLLKTTAALTPTWLRGYSGVTVSKLRITPAGDVYHVGRYGPNTAIGAFSLPYTGVNSYDTNMYAARLNASGTAVAAVRLSAASTYINDIQYNGFNNKLYVAYNVNIEIPLGNNSYSFRTESFVKQLDASLAELRNTHTPGVSRLEAVNGSSINLFAAAPFEGFTINGSRMPQHYSACLTALSDAGTFNWVQYIATAAKSSGDALAVGKGGTLFAATTGRGYVMEYDDGLQVWGDGSHGSLVKYTSQPTSPSTGSLLSYKALQSYTQAVRPTALSLVADRLFFAGYSSGAAQYGYATDTLLHSAGATGSGQQPDAFVLHCDTASNLQWARRLGGPGADYAYALQADAAGNSYIAGSFAGTATFGSFTRTSAGPSDAFVAKLDPQGTVQWVLTLGGTMNDEIRGLALSPAGDLYVTGKFMNTLTAGAATVSSVGSFDVFTGRISPGGSVQWLARGGSSGGSDAANGLVLDRSGNVIVTGAFSGTASFGATTLRASGSTDAFVACYSPAGSLQWVRALGGAGADEGKALAIDAANRLFCTGSFEGSAGFGATTLVSAGSADVFVAQLSPAGFVGTAWAVGGPGNDVGNTLQADALGHLYVGGAFADSVSFGSQKLRTHSFEQNAFFAKLTVVNSWTGAISADWNDARNWADNAVPLATEDVLIPSGLGRYPLLTGGSVAVHNVSLQQNASLTVAGGTLVLSGDFDNSGTFAQTGGVVRFNGPSPQSISGNPTQFYHLAVASSGLVLNVPVSVQSVLTLNANVSSNGNLTLLSGASGTALVVNDGGEVTGPTTVQRYLNPALNAGLGYRHLAAPVAGATVTDLATSSFSPAVNPAYNAAAAPNLVVPFPTVFGYDQSRLATSPATSYSAFDKGWVSPSALSDALQVGRGYTVNLAAGLTPDFVGTLNNGTLSQGFVRGAGADAGWHLVGNPYPAPLDWSRVARADRPGLAAALYVYESTGPYAGRYRSYVNGIGNPVLPLGQAFFVRVADSVSAASLTFRNAQRLTAPDATPLLRGAAADTRPQLQLSLHSAGTADAAYVYFEAGATSGIDAEYDAPKLPNSTGLNLAMVAGSRPLAVSGLPPLTASGCVVDLHVQAPLAGTYTLRAIELLNLPAGTYAYLRDAQNGAVVDLQAQPSYSFTLPSAAAATGRFTLLLTQNRVTALNNQQISAQVELYPNPARGSVVISLPVALDRQPVAVSVFNALGQQVMTRNLLATRSSAQVTMPLSGFAKGVYTVRLITPQGLVTKRLVVE